MSSQPSLSKSKKASPLPLASMMDRLWSTPPHTLGIFNPACCATSTNCTEDGGGFEVAALTSVGSFHCQSGVVRASISVLPNRKKEEPRKRRRGKFISCDYRATGQLQLRISSADQGTVFSISSA